MLRSDIVYQLLRNSCLIAAVYIHCSVHSHIVNYIATSTLAKVLQPNCYPSQGPHSLLGCLYESRLYSIHYLYGEFSYAFCT